LINAGQTENRIFRPRRTIWYYSGMKSPVSVIGAGSWGTCLAHLLGSKGLDVRLWSFEEEVVRSIRRSRVNTAYLPGVKLPKTIQATTSLEEALAASPVILGVVPAQHIRSVFRKAGPFIQSGATLISASKGIETRTLLTSVQVYEQVLDNTVRLAAISGPSFAKEVSRQVPTAVTLAVSEGCDPGPLQELLNTPYFRVYTHPDLVGVELGGALKNVMAIAAGISDGLGLGHSARAALITRGLAEMIRLGTRMGARPETFAGLSGLGDLVLTCTGDLSRNRTVGFKLGSGMTLDEILSGMRMVAEGVQTTRSVHALARKMNVDMPIVNEVHAVLFRRKDPARAVRKLMTRSLKSEFDG